MAATGAEAVELQSVGLDHKAVLRGDLFLQPFDLTIFKLHNSPAAGTDEVVVMALVRDIVVLRLRAEVSSLGDARLAEQIQGAVDCGKSQVGVLFGQLMVHRLGRDVFLSEECRQNQFSLPSQLQLVLGQVLAKHLHFFKRFTHGL
jgi:hypothetical protein